MPFSQTIGQGEWSLYGELVPLPNLASYSALSAVGFATALGYASTSAKGFYHTIQSEVWCTWVSGVSEQRELLVD